jgi:phosphatidylglycerophosphate synthase
MRRGPLIPTGVSVGIKKYGDIKVVDLSEWGRPLGRAGARFLNDKPVTVLQVTHLHLLLALFCAVLIVQEQIVLACFLLILKGIIDAVDGELARLRERPSHVGRYWDTFADTIGLVAVMVAFATVLGWSELLTAGMVFATLIQYSLFNHYSVLMRIKGTGDFTSRLDEREQPVAYPWEKQSTVNIFHAIYVRLFSWQDSLISKCSGRGSPSLRFELTVSSFLGFGMQSLVICGLAVSSSIAHLPALVLGLNTGLMVLVLLRSWL